MPHFLHKIAIDFSNLIDWTYCKMIQKSSRIMIVLLVWWFSIDPIWNLSSIIYLKFFIRFCWDILTSNSSGFLNECLFVIFFSAQFLWYLNVSFFCQPRNFAVLSTLISSSGFAHSPIYRKCILLQLLLNISFLKPKYSRLFLHLQFYSF